MANRATSVRAGSPHPRTCFSHGPRHPGPVAPAKPLTCVPVCFQGILYHHGEVGHQHQGRRELAEPGAERVHPHPLRCHHWCLYQGMYGQGAPCLSKATHELFGLGRYRQTCLLVKVATCIHASASVPPGGWLKYCRHPGLVHSVPPGCMHSFFGLEFSFPNCRGKRLAEPLCWDFGATLAALTALPK